ncbi:ATP-binding protein [Olivibacter jilunii]|uniref:ATP-binding protein n=1 Tax=Olivibacter jilunii TaxID=985016 RepID=UPI0010308A0A|nr:ATP-binding protein [Olivibacter jilunii]
MATNDVDNGRVTVDAHESNAGTDFHILWCIERAFSLLHAGDKGLRLIAVESLTPKDKIETDPDGDKLLAVDMSEYYDGEDVKTASKIIIVQLKYSTKHSQKEWTASGICTGKKAKGVGSIIDRFVSTYNSLKEKCDIGKIEIKLVSNRPVNERLNKIVQEAKRLLSSSPFKLSIEKLKTKLNASEQKDLERIKDVANLKAEELIYFLAILNFDDCDTQSRALLRANHLAHINSLGIVEAGRQLAVLEAYVRSKTYPEAKLNNTINLTELLLEFEIPTYESIFPVKNAFKEGNYIKRKAVDEIYDLINKSNSPYPYCIHGPAGIGKTTFLQQIKDIDQDNIFILFDCYGGGAYLDPDDMRHRHEYGLLTICNEMAKALGTPLLLKRGQNEGYYIKEFAKRIRDAAEIMKEIRPGKKIYLCIDAADNSIAAARQSGSKEFISEIAGIKYPDNIKLIITTRTHRKGFLSSNAWINEHELGPFTEDETGNLLSLTGIPYTENDLKELQYLSKGIPRVISYVLAIEGTLALKMDPLKPDGKDLDQIFRRTVEQAELRSGDKGLFRRIVRHFMALPRPVPVKLVNEIVGADPQFCSDVLIDLSSGVVVEGNHVHFNDEDFETFLKGWSEKVPMDYGHIGEILLLYAESDEYASTNLALYLELGNNHEELQQVVLERKYLTKPEDQFRKTQVFVNRAKAAMKYAFEAKNMLVYSKLQVITAEATSSNQILINLLSDNPELHALFTYDSTKDRRYSIAPKIEVLGGHYYRASAILSRNKGTHDTARSLLKSADAWTKKWKSVNSNNNDFELDERDISFGIEANLRLYGAEKAMKWAEKWRPSEMIFRIIYPTISRIVSTSEVSQLEEWLTDLPEHRFDVNIEICRALRDGGLPLGKGLEKDILELERILSSGKIAPDSIWNVLRFAIEYLLFNDGDKVVLQSLVGKLPNKSPTRLARFSDTSYDRKDEVELMGYVLGQCYTNVITEIDRKPEELLPVRENIAESSYTENRYEQDRQRLAKFFNKVYPLVNYIISALVNKSGEYELYKGLEQHLKQVTFEYDFPGDHGSKEGLAITICDQIFMVVHVAGNKEHLFKILQDHFIDQLNHKTQFFIYLAQKASVLRLPVLVTELLSAAEKAGDHNRLPASEIIAFYMKATKIAGSVSYLLSKGYFDKLVRASEEIDMEAFDRIRLLPRIAGSHNFNSWQLAVEFARYVEYCSIKLDGYDDFPWESALDGIVKLNRFVLLPVLCTWDHRSVRPIDNSLLDALVVLSRYDILDKTAIAALISAQSHYWYPYAALVDDLLGRFIKDSNTRHKQMFVDNIYRDAMFEMNNRQQKGMITKMVEVLEKNNIGETNVAFELKRYSSLLDADKPEGYTYPITSSGSVENKPILLENKDLLDFDSFCSLLKNIQQNNQMGTGNHDLLSVIIQSSNGLSQNQYTSFLDNIIGISRELLPFYYFREVIEDRLTAWRNFPEVTEWLRENYIRIVFSGQQEYIKIEGENGLNYLEKFLTIAKISREEFTKSLQKHLPLMIENFSGEELYRLLEITTVNLSEQQVSEFIPWLLSQWSAKISGDFPANALRNVTHLNTGLDLLVGVYRYLLGHPDKRTRWRTAGSLVRLVEFGREDVLGELVQQQNNQDCSPFRDEKEPFYWLASKTWLWIVLHKLSCQKSELLLKLKDKFVEEFRSPERAHAQILLFIQKTCLNIESFFPGTFEKEDVEHLNTMLNSKLKPVRKKTGSKRSNDKIRFDFNYLDTVEHWFGSLGRGFDLSGLEVAKFVDDILIDDWLIQTKLPEYRNTDSYRHELTYHYKHDYPTVEPYKSYLEFQGMQYAAMRILRRVPEVKDDDWVWSSWPHWLENQGLFWDDCWLTDLKDPVPDDREFWTSPKIGINWRYEISLKDLMALPKYGTWKNGRRRFLIWESSTINWGKDYESRSITTALVKSKYAQAALNTFQTLNDRYFHHFSSENGEEDPEEREQVSNRSARKTLYPEKAVFKLIPTLRFEKPERTSVDESDVKVKGMHKYRGSLGSVFTNRHPISFSKDLRYSFIKDIEGEPLSVFESWTNAPEREGYGEDYSSGIRMYIDEAWMLRFLEKNDLCLLLQSEMHRHQDRVESSYDYNEYALYQLIKPDGTIETLSGNFAVGKKDSQAI